MMSWQRSGRFLAMALVFLPLIIINSPSNQPEPNTPQWTHLSTAKNDLPTPSTSKQQTASLILDIDKDNVNDFVIAAREGPGASLVWFRRSNSGWQRYVIDSEVLGIEAGGTYHDIDRDGDLDIVMGGDYSSNKVWWWENPYPNFAPNADWVRREIKNGSGILLFVEKILYVTVV